MKRTLLTMGTLVAIAVGGTAWVSAQTAPAAKAHEHAAAAPSPAAPAAGTGCPMMGGGMMGPGGGMMMGAGMMGPGGGLMMGGDAKVDVKNIDKGVTITITSTDAAKVKRLQKMAEAMRLMHEANMP